MAKVRKEYDAEGVKLTMRTRDYLADMSGQLALGHIAFMEHHATDNDPIDCVHLGQATVDLLFKDPICYGLFHAVRIRHLFTDGFQSIHGDGITAAPVRTICAVTHTNVSRGCITLASPLQLLPLLPEGAHDVAEFFVGQRCPGRIAGQVVGLSRTRFCCF